MFAVFLVGNGATPPPFFPDNGLFQGRPAMLDGTGSLLAGCWTSRENFSAVFCLRPVAAAEAAVVTLFFFSLFFQRGAQRLSLICILFSESGPSAVKRRQAGGGLGGGKATDEGLFMYLFGSPLTSRCVLDKFIANYEWTPAATAASECRLHATDPAGKWHPFQLPGQEMHRKLFFPPLLLQLNLGQVIKKEK